MKNSIFRSKIYGAWLGKAIGGTLGAPWEGSTGPLNLSGYNPMPSGMLPNDDLDLQVVWACRLATDWNGVISRHLFADAWGKNITFHLDEYAVAIRNIAMGIPAPHSGSYDNPFTDGMGAAIRSEIWACLAPGDPRMAMAFAYEDACVDHAGNGIFAAQFVAALESLAFVESDIPTLIEKALSFIPAESMFARSIRNAVGLCEGKSGADIPAIRKAIMQFCPGSDNFTDVSMDHAFEVAALLLGRGDFSKTVCYAVNFGQDADCTGATVGAIMGILNPDAIPEQWLKPIGTDIVLNNGILGIAPPKTLEELTDMVIELGDKARLDVCDKPCPDLTPFRIHARKSYSERWFQRDWRNCKVVLDNAAIDITFPGNFMHVDFAGQRPETLQLLEFTVELNEDTDTKLVVNTPAVSRVWIDGQFAFGRDGGAFVPAFHRTPINQASRQVLSKGIHKIVVGVAPFTDEQRLNGANLYVGLARSNNSHIIGAFK